MFNHTQYYVYVAKDIKAIVFAFKPALTQNVYMIPINSFLCQKKGGGW